MEPQAKGQVLSFKLCLGALCGLNRDDMPCPKSAPTAIISWRRPPQGHAGAAKLSHFHAAIQRGGAACNGRMMEGAHHELCQPEVRRNRQIR
jgi:hypothetical protein